MRFWGTSTIFFLTVYLLHALMNYLPLPVVHFYTTTSYVCFTLYFCGLFIQIFKEYLFTSKIDIRNKAVLITGCDTGFGNLLARRFDKIGFKVFACCLDPKCDGAYDLKETCSSNLQVIELNVTSDESVQKAVEIVKNNLKDSQLWAVVNNAGVLRGFQTELSLMKDYEDCIQVNTLGVIRVTRAFLPFLRKSKGRVVNLCSISGRISCPFISAYIVSKHAAIAYTENIMHELREFGISVVSVEPEFFSTQICSKEYLNSIIDSSLEKVPEEVKADYGNRYIYSAKTSLIKLFGTSCSRIELVLNALEAAVTRQHPPDTYKPCRNVWVKLFFALGERVPRDFMDIFMVVLFYVIGLRRPTTGQSFWTKVFAL